MNPNRTRPRWLAQRTRRLSPVVRSFQGPLRVWVVAALGVALVCFAAVSPAEATVFSTVDAASEELFTGEVKTCHGFGEVEIGKGWYVGALFFSIGKQRWLGLALLYKDAGLPFLPWSWGGRPASCGGQGGP